MKFNIWRVAVRPSYIWDARFLKVKKMLYTAIGARSPLLYIIIHYKCI